MVEISIVCLIYKSVDLTEALYESVLRNTPLLASRQAEFLFIANDPTDDVVEYLVSKKVPHYININEHLSDEQLFDLGVGAPEYIRRVYQGYNYGILKAKGQKVVLINSDNFFSPDWLENLLKYSDYKKVVCSTLVEPGQGKFGVFPFAIEKHFGRTLKDFREDDFLVFAEKNSKTGYSSGGAYMPCLLYKDVAVLAGLYPEGNIAGKDFGDIKEYGDEHFYKNLKNFGIEHITAKDSIVYHLKEGEKSESLAYSKPYKASLTKSVTFNKRIVVKPTELIQYLTPDVKHQEIIDALGKKATVLIINPENAEEVDACIRIVKSFNFKNIETVLISDDKDLANKYGSELKVTYAAKSKTDRALYETFHNMFGEHLLQINVQCEYAADLFDDIENRKTSYYFGGEELIDGSVIDYMGNYLISKDTLINRIPTFLGFLISKEKMRVDLKGMAIANISRTIPINIPETVPVDLTPPSPPLTVRNVFQRAFKKFEKDGIRGIVRMARERAGGK